eukprot:865487-Prorocentrum_minimum.AAC.1
MQHRYRYPGSGALQCMVCRFPTNHGRGENIPVAGTNHGRGEREQSTGPGLESVTLMLQLRSFTIL